MDLRVGMREVAEPVFSRVGAAAPLTPGAGPTGGFGTSWCPRGRSAGVATRAPELYPRPCGWSRITCVDATGILRHVQRPGTTASRRARASREGHDGEADQARSRGGRRGTARRRLRQQERWQLGWRWWRRQDPDHRHRPAVPGSSKDASNATFNAIQLYLDQVGGKAGNYKVELKKYDDSTAAKGGWDDATCTKNANDHVANTDEVAVMGTYNSGCAKLEVPVLNQAPDGPMLMVSHANTNPGLTKTWDPGEPDKYYPTGKRNYARVVTTDDSRARPPRSSRPRT